MTAPLRHEARQRLRKGWCPSLFEPMVSGDGLIVRLKPSAAIIDAAAARAIADSAARYGNGIVELTNRANIQLRGVRAETVAPIAAMATRLRLAATDPAVERIRSVMTSPLGPDDPGAAFDSHALAADIEHMLADEPGLAALPAKFGFLVDGGGALPLTGVSADIAVRPAESELRVEIAGAAVNCSLVDAVSVARRLALAFVALSQTLPDPARRMGDLVVGVGVEAVLAEAGCTLVLRQAQDEGGFGGRDEGPHAEPVEARNLSVPGASSVGFIPLTAAGTFGIGLPFGQVDTSGLAGIADLADEFGDGTLRTTPWRALLIVGVEADAAPRLAAHARALGLITDPADPRQAISACPGKPACGNATVDTRADATRLAASRAAAGPVHVSGCAKGCAHPGPAALTLVGADGRYDLVIDGRAGDVPIAGGLTLDGALDAFNQMRTASR
jgi:precorrin-3B synthase